MPASITQPSLSNTTRTFLVTLVPRASGSYNERNDALDRLGPNEAEACFLERRWGIAARRREVRLFFFPSFSLRFALSYSSVLLLRHLLSCSAYCGSSRYHWTWLFTSFPIRIRALFLKCACRNNGGLYRRTICASVFLVCAIRPYKRTLRLPHCCFPFNIVAQSLSSLLM